MSRAEISKCIEKIEDLITATDVETSFHSILDGCYREPETSDANKFVRGKALPETQLKFVADGHKKWFEAIVAAFDGIKDLNDQQLKIVAPKFITEKKLQDHAADFETEKIKKLCRIYSAVHGLLDLLSI